MPVWLDVLAMPVLWFLTGGLLVYVGSAALSVAAATHHPECGKLAVGFVLVLAALGIYQWCFTRPVYPDLSVLMSEDGYVLQSSGWSCAVASAANVLGAMGELVTEQEMARLAGTTTLGTSPGQVVRALRAKGVVGKKRSLTIDGLRELEHPAILLVEVAGLGPDSHAIAYFPRPGQTPLLIDPLRGSVEPNLELLASVWSGHAIECVPDERDG